MNFAERTQALVFDCLFRDDEDSSDPLLVEGVVARFGFHRERVAQNTTAIRSLIDEIVSIEFRSDGGGGMSILNLCVDKHGQQWGEHRDCDELVCLGLAIGVARWCLDQREMWTVLPGGMPYVVFDLADRHGVVS